MLQLQPGEKFIIVRGIEDHLDSGTYYVQAIIRNADSDAIIGTVNLTDKGDGHRFSAGWYVPQDPSGSGLYIVITTSVYTDAGRTTKSGNYGDKYDTYLIQPRLTRNDIPFGGPDISYKKIEQIVKKVVDERKMQEMPEMPKVDLKNINTQLANISDFLSNFSIPEAEKFNYAKIINAVDSLRQEIASGFKSMPAPEKINLEPISEAINGSNEMTKNEMKEIIFALIENIKKSSEETNGFINESRKKFDLSDKIIELVGGVKPKFETPKEDKKKFNKNRPFLNL